MAQQSPHQRSKSQSESRRGHALHPKLCWSENASASQEKRLSKTNPAANEGSPELPANFNLFNSHCGPFVGQPDSLSLNRATSNIALAPRRVSDTAHQKANPDLHEILANDLAAWSYRMHIAIYQDTPKGSPRHETSRKNPPSVETPPIRGEQNHPTQQRPTDLLVLDEASHSISLPSPSLEMEDQEGAASPPQFTSKLPPHHDLMTPSRSRLVSKAESKTASKKSEQVPERRAEKFPLKLHKLLEDLSLSEGGREIASFLPHGRAFCVYKPKEFAVLMKDYFNMTLFSSFQRQLLLYKFERVKHGRDKGAYFHELFQQGHITMSTYMRPMKTLRRSLPEKKTKNNTSAVLLV